MTTFIIVIHVIVCILLSLIILMQSGRKTGLTESFAAAESMLGAKTNVVMVKATGIFATLFIVTCLSLAFLSFKKDKSLIMKKTKAGQTVTIPLTDEAGTNVAPEENLPANVVTN